VRRRTFVRAVVATESFCNSHRRRAQRPGRAPAQRNPNPLPWRIGAVPSVPPAAGAGDLHGRAPGDSCPSQGCTSFGSSSSPRAQRPSSISMGRLTQPAPPSAADHRPEGPAVVDGLAPPASSRWLPTPIATRTPHHPRLLAVHAGRTGPVVTATRTSTWCLDLARYPELRFLDRHDWIGPWVPGSGCWMPGGERAHRRILRVDVAGPLTPRPANPPPTRLGRRRYDTADTSRNLSPLPSPPWARAGTTIHHHHLTSARQGVRWWRSIRTHGAGAPASRHRARPTATLESAEAGARRKFDDDLAGCSRR